MIQSSRAQGILRGSEDGTLRLSLVRTDQTVEVGDTVVTSGLGGVYPKGLPLGMVASIERVSGSHYFEIEVEPLSKTKTFEEVLVITSLTEEQKATADEVAMADSQDSEAGSTTDEVADSSGETDDLSVTDDASGASTSE
jgi:rod shape-determining protein MreC